MVSGHLLNVPMGLKALSFENVFFLGPWGDGGCPNSCPKMVSALTPLP